VIKWLLTIALVVAVLGLFTPWLRRRGWIKMPGDIELNHRGRRFLFPFGSTLLLSLLATLIYWMLK
jgi:hypothetical protein